MMATKGWKEIAEPILSKMIADVVGYKRKDGSWETGSYGDKRLGEVRADKLLWYRQFGMDFTNHLHSFFSIAAQAEKRIEGRTVAKTTRTPMLDSAYNIKSNKVTSRGGYE
jgi:hypothetical protein